MDRNVQVSLNLESKTSFKAKRQNPIKELSTNWQLYSMALPGLVFFALFSYYPLLWLQVAFRDFNIMDGAWHSPWVWFSNFKFFFQSQFFFRVTFNTVYINLWFILVGTFTSVLLAILLNELKSTIIKKLYQSALFLPFFLSWIVIGAFLYNLLGETYGTVNTLLTGLGLQTVPWYSDPKLWRPILIAINTWQSAGYGVVIYLSTIVSINTELFEAAQIDGANRFQQIKFITIPHLIPTITIMVLMAIGRIFYGNFGMFYALIGDNGLLYQTTDIIDTYIFRAMRMDGTYGMATAVGLYQSIVGFIVVMVSNKLTKRYDDSLGLF